MISAMGMIAKSQGRARGPGAEPFPGAEVSMRYPMAEAGHGYTLQARIPARSVVLEGEVHVGDESRGIVLFVHGSGSSRFSPRDEIVARSLRDAGLATLLLGQLTRGDEAFDV